ncbi:hypothetical protein CK203_061604 [Vitis vinifera]|uniref:Uncharacterized protein n=1 Tax=Vitis vinifera TaxID=29760 RepID=A0A438FRL4_VITVI|nr:hypothetical protein CK203_061604 [Vitis vinifera]
MQILEYLGYPFEPQLERRRICREIFTLDKWTSMTAYGVEPGAPAGLEHPEIPHPQQPEEPQPVKIPADMRAPALQCPLQSLYLSCTLLLCHTMDSPCIGRFSEHPYSTGDSSSCSSGADYRHSDSTYCHRQIQHHMGILSAPKHLIPIISEPTEPSQAPHFVEQTMPSEEPTTGAAEPSSSHHPPTI